MSRGILLFAHGARDPEWARPFEAIRVAVAAGPRRPQVALAFLELMSPGLAEAAEGLVAAGVDELWVVPLFMAPGGHVRRDLPPLVADLCERHPGLKVELCTPIGEVPELTAAIAAWIGGLLKD